ncbi:MBL fold metallo-hydrolase [Nocardia sp. NPDC049220]|uniref:MBL fold metallo-hydrolase n=1 Tax=Nocardia sp. NPDC049220 TaxID=3155273 RepID=UPI0033C7ADE9
MTLEHTTVHRREIAPGVLVYEGEHGMPNAVALIGSERLVVVDSLFTPRHAEVMMADVRTVTDLPVSALVNTHFHGDHTLGNGVIPTDRIIAAAHVKQRLETRGAEYLDLLCGIRPDLEPEIENVAWVLPTEEIDGPLDLDLGGLTAQLRPVRGAAHTEADLYVLVPEHRVLIASDLIFNGVLPVARDSDLPGLRAALHALDQLDVDVVVPGHGRVGGRELIAQQLAVLEDIEAAVYRAAADGCDLTEAAVAAVATLLHADERIAPYVTHFGRQVA